MQIVLVTGGAGFIGSHLCERLLEEGKRVICIDNLLTGNEENLKNIRLNNNFQFFELDVVKPLPEKIKADFVFHLASPASPNHHSKISYHNLPMETMLVNTVGTLELLKFSLKNNARFLFASTSEVYGDPLIHPQSEEYRGNVSTTGPRSVYDEAKRFGETLTSYFYKANNLDTRIVRIFNTYGPRMNRSDMRMIANFILQALSNKPLTIYGNGKQTRSLNYVGDTVAGIYRMMFNDNAKGEIINIGSEDEYTVFDYANLVLRLTGSKSKIEFSEQLPQDDPIKRRPDISKAKKLLNWEPVIKLEDGIMRMIDYYKSN